MVKFFKKNKLHLIYLIIISIITILLSKSSNKNNGCKDFVLAKNCYTTPKILFHASENRNINILEPRSIRVRNKKEGSVVFASSNLGFVSMFLCRFSDKKALKGCFHKKNFHYIHSNKKEFIEKDKGGAVYFLPSDSFYSNPRKGMRGREWVSKEKVKPLYKMEFDSALDTMIDLGIQVFFVDENVFEDIKINMKNNSKHVISVLTNLESENQKRNKNILPFH